MAQGKKRRGQGRLREGLDGDGCQGRLPPPRRGQADRARRRRRRPSAASGAGSRQVTATRARCVVARGAGRLLGWTRRAGWPVRRRPPKPKPNCEPIVAADRRPAGLEAKHRQRRVPAGRRRQRRHRSPLAGERRHRGRARGRQRPRALARQRRRQALAPASAATARVAAVVTRDGELVALEAGQVKWRKALGVARRDRAAGGRRARLRARRRPRGAGLRRARRPPSSGRCSAPATR